MKTTRSCCVSSKVMIIYGYTVPTEVVVIYLSMMGICSLRATYFGVDEAVAAVGLDALAAAIDDVAVVHREANSLKAHTARWVCPSERRRICTRRPPTNADTGLLPGEEEEETRALMLSAVRRGAEPDASLYEG